MDYYYFNLEREKHVLVYTSSVKYEKIYSNQMNKKIFVVTSPAVQENYKRQLFDDNKLEKNKWIMANEIMYRRYIYK